MGVEVTKIRVNLCAAKEEVLEKESVEPVWGREVSKKSN